jgi:hypothetical protein
MPVDINHHMSAPFDLLSYGNMNFCAFPPPSSLSKKIKIQSCKNMVGCHNKADIRNVSGNSKFIFEASLYKHVL